MQSVKLLSESNIRYILGFINKIASYKDSIDDLHIASDKVWSSHHIDQLLQQLKEENENYTDAVCSALKKLTAEKTTTLPTLDTATLNVIYLYSADGTAPFEQYLKISNGTTEELIDMGSTSIDISDMLSKTEAENTYTKKTETKAITDVIGTESMGTTATTIKGAIAEINEKADKSGLISLTTAQYNTLVSTGSVVVDGETITYSDDDYYVISDDNTSIDVTKYNIKTFTSIEQLGITSNFLPDIIDAMPNGSRFERGIINTDGIYLDTNNQLPNMNGYLEITKGLVNGIRTRVMYTVGANAKKGDTYFCDIDNNAKTITGWKRIVTTSVSDMPWTVITPTSALLRGIIKYRIKNGVCFLVLNDIISLTMSTNNQIIATGLPKPESEFAETWFPLGANVDSTSAPIQSLLLRINSDGSIVNYFGTNNIAYFGTISYPVAKS